MNTIATAVSKLLLGAGALALCGAAQAISISISGLNIDCAVGSFGKESKGMVRETRAVSGYTAIKLAMPACVEVQMDGREGVEIEGEKSIVEVSEAVVENGTLVLRPKAAAMNQTFKLTKPYRIRVSARTLESLTISGSGDIVAGRIKSPKFTASISGSGDIDLRELEAEQAELRISGNGDIKIARCQCARPKLAITGSGNMKLGSVTSTEIESTITGSGEIDIAGKTSKQRIDVRGSGEVRAARLASDNTSIDLRGSGEVEVWVARELTVSAPGAGEVRYYGKPRLTINGQNKENIERLGDKP